MTFDPTRDPITIDSDAAKNAVDQVSAQLAKTQPAYQRDAKRIIGGWLALVLFAICMGVFIGAIVASVATDNDEVFTPIIIIAANAAWILPIAVLAATRDGTSPRIPMEKISQLVSEKGITISQAKMRLEVEYGIPKRPPISAAKILAGFIIFDLFFAVGFVGAFYPLRNTFFANMDAANGDYIVATRNFISEISEKKSAEKVADPDINYFTDRDQFLNDYQYLTAKIPGDRATEIVAHDNFISIEAPTAAGADTFDSYVTIEGKFVQHPATVQPRVADEFDISALNFAAIYDQVVAMIDDGTIPVDVTKIHIIALLDDDTQQPYAIAYLSNDYKTRTIHFDMNGDVTSDEVH